MKYTIFSFESEGVFTVLSSVCDTIIGTFENSTRLYTFILNPKDIQL